MVSINYILQYSTTVYYQSIVLQYTTVCMVLHYSTPVQY